MKNNNRCHVPSCERVPCYDDAAWHMQTPTPRNADPQMYDVAIIDMNNKIVSIVGKNLSFDSADRREQTALMRIDRDNYFVDSLPTGKYKVGDYRKEG